MSTATAIKAPEGFGIIRRESDDHPDVIIYEFSITTKLRFDLPLTDEADTEYLGYALRYGIEELAYHAQALIRKALA